MKRKLVLAAMLLLCAALLASCGGSDSKATSEEFFTWIVNVDGNAVVTGYTGNEQLVIVPAKLDGKQVVAIGEKAFWKNDVIVKVEVPKGVTTIEYRAFSMCDNLQSVMLPDTVTKIDEWAFLNSENLASVNLPKNLEHIGEEAFSGCTSLKMNIVLPESMTYMGANAFRRSGITGVTIPCDIQRELISWGGWFKECTNLKTVVYKEGVTTVHFFDFSGYDDAGIVTIMDIDMMTIPASVTTFYDWYGRAKTDPAKCRSVLFNCRINGVRVQEGSMAHSLFTNALTTDDFYLLARNEKQSEEPYRGTIN